MFQPLVDMFAARQPETGEPHVTRNASTSEDIDVWYMIAWNNNDIRAVPILTCGSHPPAYIGGCNMCHQV
jgi:hypothetical protein